MTKKTLLILSGIILFFNFFMIYKLYLTNNSYRAIKKPNNNEYLKIYQNNFIHQQKNELLKLDKNTKLLNLKRDTILLKNIAKGGKIFLNYSYLNCRTCIESELNNLKNTANIISNNLIILANYNDLKSMMIDSKKLQSYGLTNTKIYKILDNKLHIPIEKLNVPFYFYSDEDLRLYNVFIPLKSKTKMTLTYLKTSIRNF